MDSIEELPDSDFKALDDRFDPLLDGRATRQLDFELCVMLLDTHPSSHYNHLEHLLKFESSRLSSSHASLVGENTPLMDPTAASPFSPYSMPDSVGTCSL